MTQTEFKELFRECFYEILPLIKYPKIIKGNTMAAELLGISPNALCQRVRNGKYKENFHFKKKSDRIYLWDRDTLLREKDRNETL